MRKQSQLSLFPHFLKSIGGKNAVSDRTIFAIIAISFVVNLSQMANAHIFYNSDIYPLWVLARLVTGTGYFMVIRILRPYFLPVIERRSRPVTALVAYAGIALPLSLVNEVVLPDLASNSVSVSPLLTAFRAMVVGSLFAFFITRYEEIRELTNKALSEQERLIELRNSLRAEISSTLDQTKQSINDRIVPAISEIMSLLQVNDSRNSVALEEIKRLLDTVLISIVRPVSRDLQQPVREWEIRKEPQAAQRTFALNFPVDLRTVIRPGWSITVFVIVIYMLSLPRYVNLMPILYAVQYTIIYAGILWLVRRYIQLPSRIGNSHFSWILLLGIFSLDSILSVTFVANFYESGPVVGRNATLSFTAPIAIAQTLFSYVLHLNAANQSRVRILNETNHELETLIAQRKRELWTQQSRLSWVVHGPIQSAIVAASAEINQGNVNDEQRLAIALHLQEAVAQLDQSVERKVSFEMAISELATVWSRVCDVAINIDPAVSDSINVGGSEYESAIEIVRESISNAIRHGKATEIEAAISFQPPNTIQIRVANNGLKPKDDSIEGLGTSLYNQVTTHWHLETSGNRTTLHADLTIAQ